MQEKGTISIHSENIFPIIKKFLYSDNEIFLRELVSNAVDASQKLTHLVSMREFDGEIGDLKIKVSLDAEKKTITISDRGIGMTADEIKKYINQIAFSGATEFVEKYKDKTQGEVNDIIGHFGLGFYSAYMVADKVEINTLSYKEGSESARWICDGSTEFEISAGDKTERGTDIILHVSEEGAEFLNNARLSGILDKYCKFLPVEIEFEEKVVNNTDPIWTKAPSDLKDEDYISFYKELYPFQPDPLFWIHLNVDYPFNLTGILYFPKVKNDFEPNKSKIQLYSRQVFITDEVKNVVPEFLTLLHGVIDSPDIPLNVSRSFLQADGNVRKINSHITKKVVDKLSEIYKKDREGYNEKWEDISIFVKYGILSDDKFAEKAKKILLLKNTNGEFFTVEEYKEKISTTQKDKEDKVVVLYAANVEGQNTFIKTATDKGYDVLELSNVLDSHLIGKLEQENENLTFKRVDSDTIDKLIDKDENIASVLSEDEEKSVKELFDKVIGQANYAVSVTSQSPEALPVSVTMPEFMRRMKDMQMAGGGGAMMMGDMPDSFTVAINGNHELVQAILKEQEEIKKEDLAKQAFDIALLSQGLLTGEDLTKFVYRSVEMIK